MKLKLIIFTILSFCFLNFSIVNAGELKTSLRPAVEKMKNSDGAAFFQSNIGDYIRQFLKIILIIGALACLFYLVTGGLEWITSSGDKQKIEEARNKITSAIVGLAILASVYVIWKLVLVFFGLDKTDLLKVE